MANNLVEGIDELKQVHLIIASTNTWQDVIISPAWKNSKPPSMITGDFVRKVRTKIWIYLEENTWKFQNGNTNFTSCQMEKNDQCMSIYDNFFSKSINR